MNMETFNLMVTHSLKQRLRSMRSFLKLSCVVGSVLIMVACNRSPDLPDSRHQQVIVGLSPYMTDSAKEEVYQRLIKLVLETMPLNSSIAVYDAFANQSITKFEIPNSSAFRKTRTRINQFEHSLNELRSFLLEGSESSTPSHASSKSFHIRFPQWTQFISRNVIRPDSDTYVVVLGSPFYEDERESGFSMKDGYFPSDAHLSVSREVSIYGLQGHETDLNAVHVFWGFFNDDWISAVHQEKVSRFWSLFTSGQGGVLEVFCQDIPTVFDQLTKPDAKQSPSKSFSIDPSQGRVEMLRIKRDIGSSDWITTTLPEHRKIAPPLRNEGPLKIGIRWNGDMDLDLYSRAREGGETLFFENTECDDGYYYKDHRASPDREYEFIEFDQPVQLDQVRAWVNLFEGQLSRSPVFEVRLEFENQIYVTQMSIDSKSGNRGRTGSEQNHCWVEIDIPGVMGIGK